MAAPARAAAHRARVRVPAGLAVHLRYDIRRGAHLNSKNYPYKESVTLSLSRPKRDLETLLGTKSITTIFHFFIPSLYLTFYKYWGS